MAPLWPDHAVLASGALQSADALAVRIPQAVIFSSFERITGYPESAGLNRHVVGGASPLQERK
jgi:hypothetical protein